LDNLNIDRDIAGAYVIARRGLGFKERLPKNYKELLNDTDFLLYTIAKIEEKNEYKRNKLISKTQKKLKNATKTLRKWKE
jgi:hypothetical protein